MIRYAKFQVGDVVGTTSGSPLATVIKAKTWGWREMFSQDLCSHIAVVVDRGDGLLYFAEMLAKGIELTEIHKYDHSAPRQHICWIGRHPALGDLAVRNNFNRFILSVHAHKVRYGYDDLAAYIADIFRIKLKDKESTLICSELPRVGFKACQISYPSCWEPKCSPMDWQCWVSMRNVKSEVVV